MAQMHFHTHNLRIKIPIEKDIFISDSDNISHSPLRSTSSLGDKSFPEDSKKTISGVFSQIYYLIARCFIKT